MAKLFQVLLLCALVIQVYSLEIVNGFDNSTETESDAEVRFLLSGLVRQCRAKLQASSGILPTVTVTLTRLSNNRLYFFSPIAAVLSFDSANTFCKEHGMNLVTINSQRENELVYAEAVARGLAGGAAAGTGAWIGLRDITTVFLYKWILNGKINTFNFFSAGPPALAAGLCIQYIPAINPGGAATSWLSAACAGVFPFICELEAPCNAVL